MNNFNDEKRKILLTGGTSFIGKNIASYFEDSKIVDILNPTHQELDLLDEIKLEEYLNKHKIDMIIHAAMYNKEFEHSDMMIESVRMFANLLKYNKLYSRMLYFGSGAEYDKTYDICSVREEEIGKHIPRNNYGLAKYVMNNMAKAYENVYNMRLFAVYGPYEDYLSKFISNAMYQLINENRIIINQNVVFDYMYVDDLCKIVEKFLDKDLKYNEYNICSGRRIDLKTIANKIMKEAKLEGEIIVVNEKMNKEYTGDNSRLLQETSYSFVSIDDGISKLYNFYLKHGF